MRACVRVCTYGGGVLLLLVQSGAAPLLAVAVLLQGVKHLIGQLQVHPQPVAHVDLWSKLQRQDRAVTMATAGATAPPLIQRGSGVLLACESAEAAMQIRVKLLAASV